MPPPTASLSTKLKVQLKLSVARLKMVQSRDASLTKSSHRTVAQLLEARKPDSARIRVESIIRADVLTELHEILELYCELLLARFGLLDASGVTSPNSRADPHNNHHQQPVCDPGLEEAVKSLIYAAPRTEIKELLVLRTLLGEKFGKDFLLKATEGVAGGVSEKVVRRLGVEPPKPELVDGYLEEIARAYNVDWPQGRLAAEEEAEEELDLLIDMDEEERGGDGGSGGGGQALAELELLKDGSPAKEESTLSPPNEAQSAVPPKSPGTELSLKKSSPSPRPSPKATEMKPIPKAQPQKASNTKPAAPKPTSAVSPGGGVPDLSELEQRFAALKKLG
ncbi:hypothetical protein jhhlp_003683 [Lomentospora prolificans]|uniref:DUF292-domain-containing protein n=1 Tax=Lomentospora prolificans TaxID=41688 RepID=A0A2N3N9G2_9PEZI|nr:hypothetical protein jhhlp_003683 [Lomentospora prolificans]